MQIRNKRVGSFGQKNSISKRTFTKNRIGHFWKVKSIGICFFIEILQNQTFLYDLGTALSTLDCTCGFAEIARERSYVRPMMDERFGFFYIVLIWL